MNPSWLCWERCEFVEERLSLDGGQGGPVPARAPPAPCQASRCWRQEVLQALVTRLSSFNMQGLQK